MLEHDGALLWVHLPFFPDVEERDDVAVISGDFDALPVIVRIVILNQSGKLWVKFALGLYESHCL